MYDRFGDKDTPMTETEADTCRKFVVPMLQKAGWDHAPHAINEQRTFTDGRIVFAGGKAQRGSSVRHRPVAPDGTGPSA